ncbi:MAG: DUF4159 domain-containing protein [Acidobacteria bacterium]|nr:DUF4159 domain-containing protein [Acidobacteriota bacterium]
MNVAGPQRRRGRVLVALLGAGLLLSAGAARAQFFGGRDPVVFPSPSRTDRAFSLCRIMYTSSRREPSGAGWRTDYPFGEINLMTRFSELTRTPVPFRGPRRPEHYVVRITDDALFQCPFTMASDVGTMSLSPIEVERLRDYLLKGGFLWVDDFWGSAAWEQWEREIAQVLPPSEYPIEDVALDDPIFNAQFVVHAVPQISNIAFWRATGGSSTSERGPDSAVPHFRAIRDTRGRILVVMSHNTDIADSWEREGEDAAYFFRFSPNGYAVGINVLLHALSH